MRDLGEILATLDTRGKLDGLSFMPEMASYCRGRFHVHRRAERVYLDVRHDTGRIEPVVLLENVRCDGSAHGGCQMGCLLMWKDAWLKPASTSKETGRQAPADSLPVLDAPPAMDADMYSCQATELYELATPSSSWNLWLYLRDYFHGERSLREISRMLSLLAWNHARWRMGWKPHGIIQGQQNRTPIAELNLQPGELVQVKSLREIVVTLDKLGRNRGLAFGPEMASYCGGTYQVARRIEKKIIDWSGQMRELTHTVALEGVTCSGIAQRCCPRACYHLWREIWLKRVEGK
ncbi:MAG: hypothetical protein JW829_03175 [Pirellulales bacterium]|nr:hypothetical protein [Pirellulales bacterium]